MEKKVVHCLKDKYDVYIGRPHSRIQAASYEWGNPFVIGKDGTREEVIRKYEEWVRAQPHLMIKIRELRGKIACHGDVLVKIANEVETEVERVIAKITALENSNGQNPDKLNWTEFGYYVDNATDIKVIGNEPWLTQLMKDLNERGDNSLWFK